MSEKDNKIETIINNFIKQIYELDKSNKKLDEKVKSIDTLVENLIDYCIKKKIFYYVENKISYSNIAKSFKIHLITYIKNLIDPTNTIIDKYIGGIENNEELNYKTSWDNVSDVNSLMFKNFKQLNESFDKNVSFKECEITQTNYDENNEGFEYNIKSSSINTNLLNSNISTNFTNNNEMQTNLDNLGLYIKILINQNKYMVEFVDKLNVMCKILSDPDIKYKKVNPFE